MHLLLTYYKQRKREFLWSRPWPVTMRRDGRRVEALLLSSAHFIVLSVLINVSRKPLALQMLRFVRSRGYNRVSLLNVPLFCEYLFQTMHLA